MGNGNEGGYSEAVVAGTAQHDSIQGIGRARDSGGCEAGG